jgi:hypothetical protein
MQQVDNILVDPGFFFMEQKNTNLAYLCFYNKPNAYIQNRLRGRGLRVDDF